MKNKNLKRAPHSRPLSTGCVTCEAAGKWWLHLRRCVVCGFIGCCDDSPGKHAKQHAIETGHSVVVSFEPLQHWFYDYRRGCIVKGSKLLPPHSRPLNQPSPGPNGRVPDNWLQIILGEGSVEHDGV